MRTTQAEYNSIQTVEVDTFVNQMGEHAKNAEGVFDSVSVVGFLKNVQNSAATVSGVTMPAILQKTLDSLPEESHGRVMSAILDGIASYERQHGVPPTADVIESALYQGYGATDDAVKRYNLPAFDSATSAHHDQISLQPNRAVIAITAAMAEAIPVANYLPTDIGSNEAKLIIVSHTAGTAYGQYALDQLMDGISSGDAFVTSKRVHSLTDTGAAHNNFNGILTQVQTDAETCNQSATAVKLLKGRTIFYVNGYPVARDIPTGSATASAIVGVATIAGTDYAMSGTVNVNTGAIAVAVSPAFPAGIAVIAEGVIDYEASPGTIPQIRTLATPFQLFASPWKVNVEQTIDARTQFANELGLDPNSESMLAVRNQFANERHYEVLRKANRLGANNTVTYNFQWTSFGQQKTRSQIWQDFSATLQALSQSMAENTIDHGITHLYVGKNIAANFLGMGKELFEPSGITGRPGIYRLGRLFGQYEVYYTPKVATESGDGTTSKIICIGRSTQVARCAFVLGDAVAPTINPLPYTRDQVAGSAFYARNFTEVNPHKPSAQGCAIINVTNLV